MRTVYYVNEEDPTKAESIIKTIMAPNETVVAYGPYQTLGQSPSTTPLAASDPTTPSSLPP